MSGIGDRLREERERLGMSQAVFGELGGVKANAQGNYEKGDRYPDAAYLAAVAERGVDVLYVVTGERRPTSADSISSAEVDLLEHYRQLPANDQTHTNRMVTAMAEMAGRYEVNGDK
ncbi:transcriptional regulator [Pseudomonas sp. PA15(2017)]|uniref:helix-turn-helix domain-containing protein n=1 Tax=Pseudomonas sp. PA15(2017) TaxID=1932111 RepID=UPI0009612690|nr:helix-turn-helix transcriptional regulator [Pseudomonas sp. PA15(2017)]OLU22539.1 transcriptional regulator [Pseudomonas sp. PA15(2017)]